MAIAIERRHFITILGSTAVWPLAARAQKPERVRRIAWLGVGRADASSPYVNALRAGLNELGWTEGRNLEIGLYWAKGRHDMESVARELIGSGPEVIVTQEFMAYAVQPLTHSIPVVFGFSGDPVDAKLVQSFARPGGNLTGMTYLALELVGKRIELLKEWVPKTQHVAILARPQHPGETPGAASFRRGGEEVGNAVFVLSTAGFCGNGGDFPSNCPGSLRRTGRFS
jgi:putative ABC transport system substrate-binding protein